MTAGSDRVIDSRTVSKQAKRDRQRQNREVRRQYEQTIAKRRKRFKTMRNFAIAATPVLVLGIVLSISNGGSGSSTNAAVAAGCREIKTAPKPKTTSFKAAALTINPTKSYTAEVDTSCGSFTILLDAKEAPKSVNSFAFLADQKFYDGLTFHRIAKGFVIQGGDPKGDGTGGPGYTLPDEPPAAGYQKGSVALANSGTGTSGSQFFVVTTDKGATALGGPPFKYSILGQVTDGFDTVQRIASLSTPSEKPKATVLIEKITVTETSANATTTTTAPTTSTT